MTEREAIARIIDPLAAAQTARKDAAWRSSPTYDRATGRWAVALAKADAILALRPAEGGGEAITMQDVRLAVGEGKLTPADVLAGCNAELRRRAALRSPAIPDEKTNG